MTSKADSQFAERLRGLFSLRKDGQVTIKDVSDGLFDVEIRFAGLGKVAFRVRAITTSHQRYEVESDPRGFGDTDAVVQRAMATYHPGVGSSWTETTRHVSIQGWNLPGLGDYTATFEYNPDGLSGYSRDKPAEDLIALAREQIRAADLNARKEKEQGYIASVDAAFDSLR